MFRVLQAQQVLKVSKVTQDRQVPQALPAHKVSKVFRAYKAILAPRSNGATRRYRAAGSGGERWFG